MNTTVFEFNGAVVRTFIVDPEIETVV